MYDVIIGHYGEDKKYPFWGSKIILSSWKCAHWWKTASSTTYILVLWNFENFGFCDHFSKRNDFLKFLGSKNQNLKNPRQPFCRPCFSMYHLFFVCIWFKNSIFGEFSNIYLLSAQNRVKWRHKIRLIAKNFRPILVLFARDDAKLMPDEVCQVSCRYSNKWRSYSRKTEGESDPTPQAVAG